MFARSEKPTSVTSRSIQISIETKEGRARWTKRSSACLVILHLASSTVSLPHLSLLFFCSSSFPYISVSSFFFSFSSLLSYFITLFLLLVFCPSLFSSSSIPSIFLLSYYLVFSFLLLFIYPFDLFFLLSFFLFCYFLVLCRCSPPCHYPLLVLPSFLISFSFFYSHSSSFPLFFLLHSLFSFCISFTSPPLF